MNSRLKILWSKIIGVFMSDLSQYFSFERLDVKRILLLKLH